MRLEELPSNEIDVEALLMLSEKINIDPSQGKSDGPLATSSLNAFYYLPRELQPYFLSGLYYLECYLNMYNTSVAWRKHQFDNRIEEVYKTTAGQFASDFDEDYWLKKEQGTFIDPRIEKLREIFLEMTNGHNLEQIEFSLKILATQRYKLPGEPISGQYPWGDPLVF